MRARIALINAVPAAISPAVEALAADFPQAEAWNLLDDRLLGDADAAGGLTDPLRSRMQRLIAHAVAEGADGVLLTCSLYGPVAQAYAADVPVLAPDEAAFAEVAEAGYGRVVVVASFEGAAADSVERLRSHLAGSGSPTEVTGLAVPDAMVATRSGSLDDLVVALEDACRPLSDEVDAIFLAQYSLAPAAQRLQDLLALPVLSGPKSAAVALAGMIRGHA